MVMEINIKKVLFTIGNNEINNVRDYKCILITFTKLNKVNIIKTLLKEKATKAMYFVLSKSKDKNISVECKLKISDSMVPQILLNGCEIWGYENIDIIENIKISFLRHILPEKKGTPLFMWRTRKEASYVIFKKKRIIVFGLGLYPANKQKYISYCTN